MKDDYNSMTWAINMSNHSKVIKCFYLLAFLDITAHIFASSNSIKVKLLATQGKTKTKKQHIQRKIWNIFSCHKI
jgi:hypothetical protein